MKAPVVANTKSARPVRGMLPRDRGKRSEFCTTNACRFRFASPKFGVPNFGMHQPLYERNKL